VRARAIPSLSLLAALAGCGAPAFDPPNLVESVRVLAIRADKPYAAPGAMVSMEMLAFDGRPKPVTGAPMRLFWVPVVCPDPAGDAYFACYPFFGAALRPGVDVSAELTEGTRFSFEMPADLITSHAPPKSGAPYGVVVIFAMACAGHVQFVERGGGTLPPRPPLGCFDPKGVELGPDDSVFAYAQVFSFQGRTNTNPVLDHLTFAGAPVDPAEGITLDHCGQGRCDGAALDTVVPGESQEPDPADRDATGKALKEEVWVAYYVTAGSVSGGTALLYDAHLGKMPSTSIKLQPPATAGEETLWAVVHDNRGGVSWTQVPMHVK